MAEGIKKEFRIDSSDAARPPATLDSEPKYYNNIKPKKRVLVDIVYEDSGEVAQTKRGKPCKLIRKTSIYNDGVTVDTTVGEDNEAYLEFKRTGVAMPSKSNEPTLVRPRSKAVEAALKKAAKAAAEE